MPALWPLDRTPPREQTGPRLRTHLQRRVPGACSDYRHPPESQGTWGRVYVLTPSSGREGGASPHGGLRVLGAGSAETARPGPATALWASWASCGRPGGRVRHASTGEHPWAAEPCLSVVRDQRRGG